MVSSLYGQLPILSFYRDFDGQPCSGPDIDLKFSGYGIGTIAVAAIFANLLHWRATKPKNQTR